MSERSIAVYHDQGTGEFSRGCLIQALAEHFRGRARVRRIYASEIVRSDEWHTTTRMLAIPGGADRAYCAALDGRGNASISRFIEAGGAFFGVCAGAYYASARIAFEAATAGEITAQRELALFHGTAFGSLHELAAPYSLDHLHCAAVVRIHAPGLNRDLHALYWGGPAFLPDPGADYEPLLRYTTRDRALAALRLRCGRGRVVLTGVHAEITGQQFPIEVSRFDQGSFEHGMQVSATLSQLEADRKRVFQLLVEALAQN